MVLAGLESSGLVFAKSTYTDIIQRIMRRYLFKMDRDKAEIEKKEGTGNVVFYKIKWIKMRSYYKTNIDMLVVYIIPKSIKFRVNIAIFYLY